WDGVKKAVATPIKFVIDGVYNKGIVAAWNKVAAWLPGVDELEPYEPEWLGAYAGGGVVPGYTPGRDTGFIAAGGGEAMMRPEWTRVMGPDYVDRANAAARSGGVAGVRQFLGAYADGGIVQSMTDWVDEHYPMMTMTSGFRAGDPGYHGQGMAADFSNSPGNQGSPEEMALAQDIATNFGPQSLELIHANGFDRNIKDGRVVGDGYDYYGGTTTNQQLNHVHWAHAHVLGDEDYGKAGGFLNSLA